MQPPRGARWALPYCEQADEREWHGHKAKIEPGAVAARIARTLEELNAKPEAHRKAEEETDKIGRGVIGRPDGLILGHADPHCQHQQGQDKCCPQNSRDNAQHRRAVRRR